MTDPATAPAKPAVRLSGDGQVTFPERRSRMRGLVRWSVILVCLVAVAGATGLGVVLTQAQRTPREWAPYLQQRALRHRVGIVGPVDLLVGWLIHADRLVAAEPATLPALLGASADRSGPAPGGRVRVVDSVQGLRQAVASAQPGDVIRLRPGRYHVSGDPILFTQAGTAAAPITLRATRLGEAVMESDTVETFKVLAPFWRFENLTMRGVCQDHTLCEHAVHIAGGATNTAFRNNRFEDYNAQLKINGEGGLWPDRGAIEGNTFTDTAPRQTRNPVTPIDLVGASFWRVSGNIITDFVRGFDGTATYGAFFKGAGTDNVMERNLVVCEWRLNQVPGQHVGLSLGGGGTDLAARREQGRTGFEQIGGVIRDNLIAFCSDDGIYLNRAARSVIDHNTLLDTAGIDARFGESSGLVTANLIDGAVRARDGGSLRMSDNVRPFLAWLFVGVHPQRWLFRDPGRLDLRWRGNPALLSNSEPRIDLCGRRRASQSPPGAFEDFAGCADPGP